MLLRIVTILIYIMLGGGQETAADYVYGSDGIICNHEAKRDLPPVKLDAMENESPTSLVRNITPPITSPRTVSRRKNNLINAISDRIAANRRKCCADNYLEFNYLKTKGGYYIYFTREIMV